MKTTREELIDFYYWSLDNIRNNDIVPCKIDEYLKSINSASNESLSVTENEAQRKVCRKCGSSVLEVTGEPDFCSFCRTIR